MLSLRHLTILKYLHDPPSSSSLESHPKANSFSRFLGLELPASQRGVASVGDPANRGEHLGDSVVTSNALSRPLVQRKLRRKQRRRAQRGNEREKMWFAMLLIFFSAITISVSFNRSSARTLKFI